VVRAIGLVVLLVALVHVALDSPLSIWFDLVFVTLCVVAALWVHPRDFFTVGVLPPLLLGVVVLLLALVDRDTVARADDSLVQALVSGLAHRAISLAIGYGLALAILALRQFALRNRGSLRPRHKVESQGVAA
jgi:hypothetical protein